MAVADLAVGSDVISTNPRDGSVVAGMPADSPAAVQASVLRARRAGQQWAALSFAERRTLLLRWKRVMSHRRGEICELIERENGKTAADALIELTLTLEHLDWAARHAGRVLRPRRMWPGPLMFNQSARLRYRPHGVVGVIGPWNYPIYTPMGSISYALAAGNAVVFKPSEHTPAIGRWLTETFAEAVPEHPVFTAVFGYGDTGAALCDSGVDKLAFTGSAPTGRKVMAVCAQSLTPVLMELGGKDALIVDDDADLDAAVEAALWGGFMNAGQSCAGVERVYVVDDVYERFLDKLAARAMTLSAGVDYGPITMPGQIAVIVRHIDEAIADGARTVVGGRDSVRPPYVDPVVLTDVPETSVAVREETFGPVLIVNRVPDADAAVERANASTYGLGAAVYGRRRARQVASKLNTGMVAINDVISFGAVPSLPFGGVGGSGFGRIHGADGLREFTVPQSITRRMFPSPARISTFRRTARDLTLLRVVAALIGRR